jgi:8-oxo-dGTP pyrophosphatase MutT (NUDIX family)
MKVQWEDLHKRLIDYEHRILPVNDLSRSAVLVPFFEKEGELHLMLTKRSTKVKTHKGDVAFPGGMKDPEDKDLLSTALRETWEELGIQPKDVKIIGRIDDYSTITHFHVTPFVGIIPYPYPLVISEDEIDYPIEVNLEDLLNPKRLSTGIVNLSGYEKQIYFWHLETDTIWGATAYMILNLLRILFDYETPSIIPS